MTSVLPRGVRARRGVRRPGWMLLTALLVLAIAASSVLVFTSRVELLKLAVIVALWAAVAAAFVSVLYRRQSEVDQARVRDLKLVYDLQLDREISARREYELTVESQLRRELASELRAQAADEVAALRTELAALRTNLEILFDTDLHDRPALEPERAPVRAYSDWARSGGDSTTDTQIVGDLADIVSRTVENPIIDVPEVKIPPGPVPPPVPPTSHRHRRAADTGGWTPPTPPMAAVPPVQAPPSVQPPRWTPPPPQPRHRPESSAPAGGWQPVTAEGAWLPPGTPGSNWAAETAPEPVPEPAPEPVPVSAPEPAPESVVEPVSESVSEPATVPESVVEPVSQPAAAPETPETPETPEPERPARHGRPADQVDGARYGNGTGGRRRAPEPPAGEPADLPPARHAGPDTDDGTEAGTSGGQSVADLLARLQPAPTGGRRRRRED